MRIDYRAAWVPFGSGQTPDRVALAVDWIERACVEQQTTGVAIISRKGRPQRLLRAAAGVRRAA